MMRYTRVMRRPRLPNSPLVDVVFEARFKGDLSVLAKWGELQRAVKDRYPQLLVPQSRDGEAPLLQPLQLASLDAKSRILLAVNSFAFGTSSYVDYDTFVRDQRDALD